MAGVLANVARFAIGTGHTWEPWPSPQCHDNAWRVTNGVAPRARLAARTDLSVRRFVDGQVLTSGPKHPWGRRTSGVGAPLGYMVWRQGTVSAGTAVTLTVASTFTGAVKVPARAWLTTIVGFTVPENPARIL